MKLILLVILLPLTAFAAADVNIEEQKQKCDSALDVAETKVNNYLTRLNNDLARNPPHAVEGASQRPLTGNPITDAITAVGDSIQQSAQQATQISQARGQVDDDCFQQAVQLQDKAHDIRQKDYQRRREIGNAETEKLKQESEIRAKCWGEASQLYQAEMQRLAGYAQRIVGSVGGATKSQKDIQALRNNFYNNCMNSGPTKEALNMVKNDLDNKVRNFGIMAEELASDLNYNESTKTTQLKEHCKLRQERIDEQASIQKNASMQQMGLQIMGLNMAMKTASANSSDREQVIATYGSLQELLEPNKWTSLKEYCLGTDTNTGDKSKVTAVPTDVIGYFEPVNEACKPAGGDRTCVSSTGANSTEKQSADRALSSQ
ncbi:hypothetical protein K2X05_09745 [bacterium]|nr:hypothetical protein [bacterium]